jgi:hypothetical protein
MQFGTSRRLVQRSLNSGVVGLEAPQLLSTSDYLFLSLPRGMTVVVGGMGRSEPLLSFGSEVSFLGFFAILLLCICPLAMVPPVRVSGWDRSAGWYATYAGVNHTA